MKRIFYYFIIIIAIFTLFIFIYFFYTSPYTNFIIDSEKTTAIKPYIYKDEFFTDQAFNKYGDSIQIGHIYDNVQIAGGGTKISEFSAFIHQSELIEYFDIKSIKNKDFINFFYDERTLPLIDKGIMDTLCNKL